MPNIQSMINAHNKKVLEEKQTLTRGSCNCENKQECPLSGECKTTNVLYEAKMTSSIQNYGEKVYRGITKPIFKRRFGNHKKSFHNIKYRNETEHSKEVWKVKNKGGEFNIKWRIVKQYPTYSLENKRCALCLNEKLEIIENADKNSLNKRHEIVSTCRHKSEYALKVFDVT